MPRRAALLAALASIAVSISLPVSAGDESPLPYRLLVSVAYGEPLGPESLREELERELTERLDTSQCFRSVDRLTSEATGSAELVAEVVLDRFEEGSTHDVSIAVEKRPDAEPGTELQWRATIESVLHLQVRRASDRAVVRIRRKHMSVTRAAQPAEDTRFEARQILVETLVREVRSELCNPSAAKWEKWIRKARPVSSSD